MAEYDGVAVRTIRWSDIIPWLSILRIFRLATSLRLLAFGASGMLLTLMGWWLLALFFFQEPEGAKFWWKDGFVRSPNPWTSINHAVRDHPQLLPGEPEAMAIAPEPDAPATWPHPIDPFFGTWAQLSRPVWRIFVEPRMAPRELACMTLSALWALAVWGFFGGAVSRIAAVELASDERVGWAAALRYATAKWLSYFAAPLFPLFGILLIATPLALLGLLMRAGWGLFLLGIFWPLFLAGGFVMAMLLLGLVFGWPLMWATISAEGTDTFDALSRSYAYTFQRPLRYLFYAVVAAVLGLLGWLLVANFAAAIISLALWATSWGSGAHRLQQISSSTDVTGLGGPTGAAFIHFWGGCVKWLALGYVYGYFWTAATAIYFQLRRDVDATELDEVFLEADASEQSYGLPPVETAGAPPSEEPLPTPAPAPVADTPSNAEPVR